MLKLINVVYNKQIWHVLLCVCVWLAGSRDERSARGGEGEQPGDGRPRPAPDEQPGDSRPRPAPGVRLNVSRRPQAAEQTNL